jgi:hypothetical protein
LKIDGQKKNNATGELLFSNGTDSIVLGNDTHYLRIHDNAGFLMNTDNMTEYLMIANGSHPLVNRNDSLAYEYIGPLQGFSLEEIVTMFNNFMR